MIVWNKVTWYSKLAAVILFIGIIPVLTFYIGTQYQKTLDSLIVSTPEPYESNNSGIDIAGIEHMSLASAPVPSINGEYNGVSTTSPARNSDETIARFKDFHWNFSKGIVGCGDQGAFDDLELLGYTLMGGVPTAVTIDHQRVCGNGYFPSIVLYQAKGEYNQPEIVAVNSLYGADRIEISNINLSPNHISLTFLSRGEEKNTTVNFEYVGGRLVKR